jgi:hypothetical protein
MTPTTHPLMDALYQTLAQRKRPEDVIKLVVEHPEDCIPFSETCKQDFARVASQRTYYWQSSMNDAFSTSTNLQKQIDRAKDLWPKDLAFISVVHADNADSVNDLIVYLKKTMGLVAIEKPNFKKDRLNRAGRKLARNLDQDADLWLDIPKGRRAYNKRFRFLARMEKKFAKWLSVREMRDLARIAKSRLAFTITPEEFERCGVVGGTFIAYVTARLNMRTKFTNTKQDRAYDEIAEAIYLSLGSAPNDPRLWEDYDSRDGWEHLHNVIARILPMPFILEHVSPENKGKLLGTWFRQMERASNVLHTTSKANSLNLDEMIVSRGNDSSTWNEAAGAFNKARDGWISTIYALGADSVLDGLAPGKVMRLMAADVASWHRSTNGGLDPDTQIWTMLPRPWEVLTGKAACTRKMIEDACAKASNIQIERLENQLTEVRKREAEEAERIKNQRGTNRYGYGYRNNYNYSTYERERLEETLNKHKAMRDGGRGWIKPRKKSIEQWKPTPELVHGVTVSSPILARLFKDAGFFGGPSKADKVKPEKINPELSNAAEKARADHAASIMGMSAEMLDKARSRLDDEIVTLN